MVIVLGLYGLKNSATRAYAQMSAGYYDPMTGIYQDIVPQAAIEYLRSEIRRDNFRRPIAVAPSFSVALSLPQFRIIYIDGRYLSLEEIAAHKRHGRAEKIFVIVQQEMLINGKAETILQSFTSYKFEKWRQTQVDGMVIYTQ